jgi:glutamate synthase domain-containing protein 3
VGTVAAGVAKCKADHVVIAGHDGGTGASPWSSIKHAGTPWELGLAETQQTLVLNRLRSRIRVQADGQMKTGRDVVIGALLGADEFGFATAPLVVEGCIMMRKCHLNTCPVGVATQDPVLRAQVRGQARARGELLLLRGRGGAPDHGAAGHPPLRRPDRPQPTCSTRARASRTGRRAAWTSAASSTSPPCRPTCRATRSRRRTTAWTRRWTSSSSSAAGPAIERGEKVQFMEEARNVNRSVGAMLSGELVRHRPEGLPDHTIFMQMEGTGGQSFGAFLATGITLYLIGDANDYTGKGLSGGRVVVRPSIEFRGDATRNIIVGNTALYGATSGEAFFRGVAGERFAVRLSGATAVVEGTGDHGCEYMTGGTVAVLGPHRAQLRRRHERWRGLRLRRGRQLRRAAATPRWWRWSTVLPAAEQAGDVDRGHLAPRRSPTRSSLRRLVEDHHRWTGSLRAREILDNWADARAEVRQGLPATSTSARCRPSWRGQGGAAPSAARVGQAHAQHPPHPRDAWNRHAQEQTSWEKSPAFWSTSAWRRATSPCRSA